MNQNDTNQPINPQTVRNPLNAMQDGEEILFNVRRHPIGLVFMYVSFILMLTLVAVVAVMAPTWLPDYDANTVKTVSAAVFLVAAVFSGIYVMIGHVVYTSNRWILTSDSLTQVTRSSLFNQQNSQLSLANLEDVTVHKDGILAHMFNFGVLKAETAGERSKFSFIYCPDPNNYAQKILLARETFEQGGGHMGATNPGLNVNTQQ